MEGVKTAPIVHPALRDAESYHAARLKGTTHIVKILESQAPLASWIRRQGEYSPDALETVQLAVVPTQTHNNPENSNA